MKAGIVDGDVDVIETHILFGVDVKINVKVRKTTSYGNPESEYQLAEIAGVTIPSNVVFDEGIKMDVIRNIREIAFIAVKKSEEKYKRISEREIK